MAGHRSLTRALAAVGVLALLAGCADDGETTTTGTGLEMPSETTEVPDATDPTTTTTTTPETTTTVGSTTTEGATTGTELDPAVAERTCGHFAGLLPEPVAGDPPEDDAPLGAGFEELAAGATEPLRSHAQALLDLQAIDDGEVDITSFDRAELEAIYEAGVAGIEGIFRWALDTCETTEVVWSCLEREDRETFTQVGEAIAGEDGETEIVTTTTAPGAATPEAVYPEAEQEGDPVEISRGPDEVVVAWLDQDGRAVAALTVVDDGGWRNDGVESCSTS